MFNRIEEIYAAACSLFRAEQKVRVKFASAS